MGHGRVAPRIPERLSGHTRRRHRFGARRAWPPPEQSVPAGHTVAVHQRADRVGGLLRYDIPSSRWRSGTSTAASSRCGQLPALRTGIEIGRDLKATDLRKRYDAVVIAAGATTARDLPVPGRELKGIHQAMEYLPLANKVQGRRDDAVPPITAEGKHVVVIGGGDTGADCVGTAHRQGAASVTQLEIMPQPGEERSPGQPWPTFPMLYKVTSAHSGGRRPRRSDHHHFEAQWRTETSSGCTSPRSSSSTAS